MQYIAEGCLSSFSEQAAGLLGSLALVNLVLHFASDEIPRAEDVGIDANVLAVNAGLCLLSAESCSAWRRCGSPAHAPNAVLTNGARSTASAGAQRTLAAFINGANRIELCPAGGGHPLRFSGSGSYRASTPVLTRETSPTFYLYPGLPGFRMTLLVPITKTRLIHALEAARLARAVGFTRSFRFPEILATSSIVPDHRDISHISF